MAEKTNTDGPAEAPAPGAGGKGGPAALLLPLLASVAAASLVTVGVAQFILLPRLEARWMAPAGGEIAALPGASAQATPAKGGANLPTKGYRFENVVVNLSGTMGTRYLKASFMVTGSHPELVARFEAARPQLGDVTLAILSSLTLADLEEPGSSNLIRERLVGAYNRTLGERVAESLYFSEFVVQ